ncbi:MAG: hypothetical protein HY563_05370, partial [Ignavibacteriales bacterium]|nr:hypothetical protein [Ignavibacteriales bacterium]
KYGDRVNVIQFGEFSKEFCGGTHVPSTADIGYFKFRSEGSVSSGTRRIEAVTSDRAEELLALRDREFDERTAYAEDQSTNLRSIISEAAQLGSTLGGTVLEELERCETDLEKIKSHRRVIATADLSTGFTDQVIRRRTLEDIILALVDLRKQVEREISRLRVRSLAADIDSLIRRGTRLNGARLVSAEVSVTSMDELKSLGDRLREKIGSGVGVLASVVDQKVALVCVVTDDLITSRKLEAGKIVGAVARLVGGGGGGRPHMATAGGKDIAKLGEALKNTESIVRSFLKQ